MKRLFLHTILHTQDVSYLGPVAQVVRAHA